MTTNNTSHSLNALPFLSEEMERMLRLRAWKDEIFREALIADPKGVIQRLFPQSFPDGKVPEELTIKVIEEDPGTCHIVLPFLSDEISIAEIPEEEHLELLAHMGADRSLGRRDSSERHESQLSEKTKPSFTKQEYMRKQAEGAAKKQETASEPTTENLLKEVKNLCKKDEEFRKQIQENPMKALQEKFPHYFNGSNVSEKQTFKVTQDTEDTRHIVLQKLPDSSQNYAIPEGRQLGPDSKWCNHSKGCGGGGGGSGTKKKSCK